MAEHNQTARQALLQRCIDYVSRAGFGAQSLREIGANVGSSHRMLLYHFGSRDGLLAAIVEHVEAEQRDALTELVNSQDDLVEVGRTFWKRVSDPLLAPNARLFFEIYARALLGAEWTGDFRDAVIVSWERALLDLFGKQGFPRGEARTRSRVALATIRGLLLDLLLTGDRRQADRSAELFIHLITSGSSPNRSTRGSSDRASQLPPD